MLKNRAFVPLRALQHPDIGPGGPGTVARRNDRRTISRRSLLRGSAALGATAAVAWATGLRTGSPVSAATDIPNTEAGRLLSQWLTAFNTADTDALLAFHRSIDSEELAVVRTTFDLIVGRGWGRTDVNRVLESTEDRIVALLHTSLTNQWPQIEIGGSTGIAFPGGDRPPTDDPLRRELLDFQMRRNGAADAPPDEVFGGDPLPDQAIANQVEKYLGELAAIDAFSGVVLLARDGRPYFTAAHGRANKAAEQPNLVTTRFNLAVMNRMFTGIAIAQLVQRHRLAFTDTLAQVLPDYPNQEVAEQITVHQLLTHTSGLGDFYGEAYNEVKDALWHPWDYFPLFVDLPLHFTPGTGWRFSSAGYIVLGAIIERVAGQDYFDYIRQHIYRPAGMTRSDSFERGADVPDLATGYTFPMPSDLRQLQPEMAFQPLVENTDQLGIKGNPAGGGYSTVEDLLAFDRALRSHRLLNPRYTDLVLAGKVDGGFEAEGRYGYGFQDITLHGQRIVGHGGNAPGANCSLGIFMDRDVTAIVLTNHDAIGGAVTKKIRRLVVRG